MEQMTEEEIKHAFTDEEIGKFQGIVYSIYSQNVGMMLGYYRGERVCFIIHQNADDGEQVLVTPLAIIYADFMNADILDMNKQPMTRVTGTAH